MGTRAAVTLDRLGHEPWETAARPWAPVRFLVLCDDGEHHNLITHWGNTGTGAWVTQVSSLPGFVTACTFPG